MSSTPSKPRAFAIDPTVQSKIAGFFLERGGKWTAVCLILAALTKVARGIFHRDFDEFVTGVFYLSLAMAYGSLFWTSKRTNDMVATGLGEIKHESNALNDSSQDPAIDRVIQKLEAGVPAGGTSTPAA